MRRARAFTYVEEWGSAHGTSLTDNPKEAQYFIERAVKGWKALWKIIATPSDWLLSGDSFSWRSKLNFRLNRDAEALESQNCTCQGGQCRILWARGCPYPRGERRSIGMDRTSTRTRVATHEALQLGFMRQGWGSSCALLMLKNKFLFWLDLSRILRQKASFGSDKSRIYDASNSVFLLAGLGSSTCKQDIIKGELFFSRCQLIYADSFLLDVAPT